MSSDLILPSRRGFLIGLSATLITAPAIVRVASIMPVKVIPITIDLRRIINMVFDENVKLTRLDVLYGRLYIRHKWIDDKFTLSVINPSDIEVDRA